jgi:hypothetical protein
MCTALVHVLSMCRARSTACASTRCVHFWIWYEKLCSSFVVGSWVWSFQSMQLNFNPKDQAAELNFSVCLLHFSCFRLEQNCNFENPACLSNDQNIKMNSVLSVDLNIRPRITGRHSLKFTCLSLTWKMHWMSSAICGGSLVTAARCILRLWLEEMARRCGR